MSGALKGLRRSERLARDARGCGRARTRAATPVSPAIWSWKSPTIPRITQARMAWAPTSLRHESGRHHLLGAGGRDRHGRAAPGRTDRLDVHPEYVLLHRDDEPQKIAGGRDRKVRDHEVHT